MSQLPPEYKMFIKKYSKTISQQLKDELVGLVLYGSLTMNSFIPGESDCNFFLVLKDEEPSAFKETFKKLEKINEGFMNDPLFMTLLDLTVVHESILKSGDFQKLSAIKAYMAKTNGKVFGGTNPFESLDIPEEALKADGKQLAMTAYYRYLNDLLSLRWGSYDPSEAEFEKSLIAMDTVFQVTQGVLWYLGERGFSKNDTIILVEEKYSDKLQKQVLKDAEAVRLGSTVDYAQFLESVPEYLSTAIKLIQ